MAWYNHSWQFRVPITVLSAQVDADLTDFPVYVNLADFGASHLFWGRVDSAGADIRITKSDETTEVPREVVSIDTSGKTGEIHFKADGTLSSSADTTFYLYYGNAAATEPAEDATYGRENTWNSGYKGVWHLGESAGSALDSTSNDNDGTFNGTMPNQSAGQVGSSQDFNGTGDYIQITDAASLDLTSGMTLSVWTFAGTDPVTFPVFISKAPVNNAYLLVLDASDEPIGRVNISTTNTDVLDTGNAISRSAWDSYVITHDATTLTMFRDGTSVDTTAASGNQDTTSGDLFFGNADGTSLNRYVGRLDEVRISNVDRGATWISTEYNNQSSSSTFYTIGNQEPPHVIGISTLTM